MAQMELNEQNIAEVVRQVLSGMQAQEQKAAVLSDSYDSVSYHGRRFLGVYPTMEEAIDHARSAYQVIREMTVEQREKIIAVIRKLTYDEAEIMAAIGVEETGMGRADHKLLKHRLVAEKTPGTEDLISEAETGDGGLTLTEMAPFGIIGSITPSTNPSETAICNCIGMLAAGNAVVFNPHPHAIKTTNYAVDLVNRASLAAGGPADIACTVVKPTMDTAKVMTGHPLVRMLVCTGGPGVVKAMLSSGKKAIGAGAGNPPVIVDDTADIPKAAKDIIDGCTFDNNLPCIAEKEVFAFESIEEELVYHMTKNGAYLMSPEETERLLEGGLGEKKDEKTGKTSLTINKKWVGKDARLILREIGVEAEADVRCAVCETDADHPFVQTELMMPILPVVKVEDIDEAIRLAVKAEHGNRHTAHMHSKNIDRLSRFARAVETTIFVKNAPSYAGIGFGGEGHCTFTIAGPTGEGLTSARSFTRRRRCVMSDAFRII